MTWWDSRMVWFPVLSSRADIVAFNGPGEIWNRNAVRKEVVRDRIVPVEYDVALRGRVGASAVFAIHGNLINLTAAGEEADPARMRRRWRRKGRIIIVAGNGGKSVDRISGINAK